MMSLRTAAAVKSTIVLLADNELRQLLNERLAQLADAWEEIEIHFLIVQAGDTIGQIEELLGWSPLVNFVDRTRFGQPDFSPSTEYIEAHSGLFWELTFILSEDGGGTSIIVCDDPETDADLSAMCREFAESQP